MNAAVARSGPDEDVSVPEVASVLCDEACVELASEFVSSPDVEVVPVAPVELLCEVTEVELAVAPDVAVPPELCDVELPTAPVLVGFVDVVAVTLVCAAPVVERLPALVVVSPVPEV